MWKISSCAGGGARAPMFLDAGVLFGLLAA
jgi:hypothetical protein